MASVTKTRSRGRPRRYDDRRLEVLRVAARTFSSLGFRQATLEDVAGALGITRPALYHYAESKDALLGECGKIAHRELAAAVETASDEPDGAGRLRAFFRRYCEIVCDDFGRCFVLTDLSEMDPAVANTMREAQVWLGHSVADMIRSGVSDGTIRDCDPIEVSRVLFASFNGVARWQMKESGRKPARIAEEILDIFFNGLSPQA